MRPAHKRMPFHLEVGRYTLSLYKDWQWAPFDVKGTDRKSWVHVGLFTIAWRTK